MATVSGNLLLVACFLALHVNSRCDLVLFDDRELAPSFERKREAEAGTSTFETPNIRTSMLRIQSRFILENIQKRKAKKSEEMMESLNRKPPVRSSIGTNEKSRSLLDLASMYIPRKMPLKREELPSLDSDYCQPQTHPPSHN